MPANIPEKDVRDFLAALPGAPFGAADVGIRCGLRRAVDQPDTSLVGVWVDASERAPGHRYGPTSLREFTADIDIKVISAPEDLDGGWAKARALRDALDRQAPAAAYRPALAGLLRYLGQNEANQHLFTVNFTLTWDA